VFGSRKATVSVRRASRVVAPFQDGYAIEYLVRLVSSFSRPENIVAAYLRRPLEGYSFRHGIEQLAKGRFATRRRSSAVSADEITTRARRVSDWLNGEDPNGKNPYTVLGLSCSASVEEIHRRYRALSKRVHPDRHSVARQRYWCARQEEINEAYRILSDPRLRGRWHADLQRRRELLQGLWEVETAAAR